MGEEERADEIDNAVPTAGYGMLPLVGLGGSAGSIGAIQEFFKSMPADSGMAFVVILHLSPDHVSTLPEMFQRSTTMRVIAAMDGAAVEANCVYVIPAGKHLSSTDGHLRLTEAAHPNGKRVAVDVFFRTLADTHGPRSVAIVLSGADGDGAIGIKRIKERGGLTIAQDPDEAEHSGMPRSAIATGMVDWVLKVQEMPARLLAYRERGEGLKLPTEDGPHPTESSVPPSSVDEAALRDILAFLHTKTACDFSYYKRATILRRIARRMQVNGLDDLPGYLVHMRTHTGEARALLQDLLIAVTNFFRDRDAFEALERMIPELFKDKGPGDTVRVWVAACATGEEAYSVAMLLCEYARTQEASPQLQVFATDLDDEVIRSAREGFYPETISADVSEDRLRRYFVHEAHGYRVRREVREIVLFAPHDLLKDSPFSRLDLVTCRNLLIYLNRDAQKRALEVFHFALRPGGVLFLGNSETVEDGSALFAVTDKKHRIYLQRPGPRGPLRVPEGASTLARALKIQERTRERPTLPRRVTVDGVGTEGDESGAEILASGVSAVDLHHRFIARLSPPSILVNSDHEIVHVSETAGRFLQYPSGEPTRNVLRAVHPALRIDLRAALYAAAQSREPATAHGVSFETSEGRSIVDIRVSPADDLAADFLLVAFIAHDASSGAAPGVARSAEVDEVSRHLEHALETTKGQLRETIEQADASTEELKASNEELQAMNEELRSATEELETSREELHSVNEELTAVNQSLTQKVDQLADANSDLNNLMSATDIATVFLDRDLRIMRFTPSAKALFNFISTDIGRPLSDLSRRLDYPEIVADAEQAIAHLKPAEREVRAGDSYFLARTLPYRTADDRIAGVVFTFLDITTTKQSDEATARLGAIVESSSDAIVGKDLRGIVTSWNAGAEEIFGYTAAEMIGQPVVRLIPAERQAEEVEILRKIAAGETIKSFETVRVRKDGTSFPISVTVSPIKNAAGKIIGGSKIARDISEAKHVEDALRASEERFRAAVATVSSLIWTNDAEGMMKGEQAGWKNFTGQTEQEYQDHGWSQAVHPDDAQPTLDAWERAVAEKKMFEFEHRLRRRDGEWRLCSIRAVPLLGPDGAIREWVGVHTDITEQRRQADALKAAKEAAETANQSKDRFLAVLSHELRTPLTPVLMTVSALEHDPDLRPDLREDLMMIKRNVELETKLIDDLLDLSRIASGKVELKSEAVDLNDAVRQVCRICQPQLVEQNVRLETDLDDEVSCIPADPARLQQVLWNILKNAVKFTPAEGVVRVSTARLGPDRCAVRVRDSGIGIPPDVLPRIFDAFEQGDAHITRQFGGLGLGLAISRALVELHGGTIRAESEGQGKGATFIIELPGAPVLPASIPTVTPGGTNGSAQIRLLLVEDHTDTARTLARLLRAAGFEVVAAADVASAIATAEREKFDLLVSDLGLPDGDGYQIMRAVRARRIIPGIAMSGYGMEEDMLKSREAGFTEHLVKPIDIPQLIAAIQRVTDRG